VWTFADSSASAVLASASFMVFVKEKRNCLGAGSTVLFLFAGVAERREDNRPAS